MRTQITIIEKEIAEIKQRLLAIGEMRPGSLSKQKRSRGGLYHQLSYSHNGKGHTEYVREELVPAVRQQLDTFRTYLELNRRWKTLAIELCKLKGQQERMEKKE
mgnify:CR=1 FL=1